MSSTHDTIGEYLAEAEPVLSLWHHLFALVHGDESRPTASDCLSRPASIIYLVGVFEGEVVKGGFRRFLAEPSGDFAGETLQALREVGAHVTVELLGKALGVFPGGVAPASREQRQTLLLAADPGDFDSLDELYNQHVDAQSPHRLENINMLLLDYMKEFASESLSA